MSPSGTAASVQVAGGAVRPAPDVAAAMRDGAELVWTALADPTPGEVAAAVRALGIPPDLVAESREGAPDLPVPGQPARRRRARLVAAGQGRGVVLLPAAYDDAEEEVTLGLLTVLVSGRAVLSVAHGVAPDLAAVQATAERHRNSPDQLLEVVLGLVVEGYDTVVEQLDDDVADVEAEVFSPDRRSRAQRIYRLKRETLELQRAVAPLGEVVSRLGCAPALRDRVLRVSEHVEHVDSLLDGVLGADLAQVGVRQNEDQRRISAWAAIGLVPTVVGAIYGMNFQHMPELSWTYGYALALLVIVAACAGLYVAFRRNGWLGPG
ncbi:MAG TPA: CorA family divalent cation transporter [Mycobacteriales bacterium]|jgi:magnesium transporter|nr:CorA family divalent cation transporter [Mycobacteriales bacterium]